MKKLLFVPIIILGLFVSGSMFAETSVLYPNDPIACTMEYAPVCGQKYESCTNPPIDGGCILNLNLIQKTYSNACAMRADGANLVHQGICGENEKPTVCTMEYAPVCGEKQVQCVKAPCYPIQKTYSNVCMLNADSANFVSTGECNDTTKTEPSFCRGNKFSKMNRGMRGDMVRALQEFLSGQGYKLGIIDGSFGLKTHKAVKDFQTAKGLKSDGVFGNNSKFAVCNGLDNKPIQTPTYTASFKVSPGPALLGSSVIYKDITIFASNLSDTSYLNKLNTIIITHDSYAVVPNPTHDIEHKTIRTQLVNGSNTINSVLIGEVISITIDGQNVPFTENR